MRIRVATMSKRALALLLLVSVQLFTFSNAIKLRKRGDDTSEFDDAAYYMEGGRGRVDTDDELLDSDGEEKSAPSKLREWNLSEKRITGLSFRAGEREKAQFN